MITFPQNFGIVEALPPATDAAGRTGDYISLKNAQKVTVICHVTQGNAAQVTFTLSQASAVAGTGKKAITNNVAIWANLDTAASDALPKRADAKSYQTDAGVKNKVVVFEVEPELAMDLNNGFDCLTVETSASNVANITQAMYIIHPRYKSNTQPSYIVD